MPLFLEFKPTKKIKMPNPIVEEFFKAILCIPSIAHQGANNKVATDREYILLKIDTRINGLSVTDNESASMLHSVLCERIKDCDFPFYVSGLNVTGAPLPGEALFLHERLKPLRSKNSRLLAKLEGLVIPEEFCCKLSGDIMDEPVYDIRSPGMHYDQDFLEYWLRKRDKKLMPHTNVPTNHSFIKTDFDLKIKIIAYVQSILQAADIESRKKILEKFKLAESSDKKSLNQALRRAAMASDSRDLDILLSLGADVNSQDENPEKRYTALHWAIRENKISNGVYLLTSGSRIDIPDARGFTAAQLIAERLSAGDPEIQPLVCNCNLLGLNLPGLVHAHNQPPIQMQVPHSQYSATLFPGAAQAAAQQSHRQAPNNCQSSSVKPG